MSKIEGQNVLITGAGSGIGRLLAERVIERGGFIIAGAFVGEKVLNGTIDMMWESSNKGKLYKHLEASLNSEED